LQEAQHPDHLVSTILTFVTTNGTWAMSHGSGLPPQSWAEAMGTFMYLQITPKVMNTPYELVYRINLDVEHIHTFECVVKVRG